MASKLSSGTPSASVLLLCGLPGSGKSTLVKQLASSITIFDKILVIDYDKILAEEMYLSASALDRLDLLDNGAMSEQAVFGSSDLEAWRKSRTHALKRLKDNLQDHFSKKSTPTSLLVIMDDNFQLKSMRRDIYRACQKCVSDFSSTIGFVVLYVSTPLEVCIEQNSKRVGIQRVPHDVIHKMANVMEPPNPSKPYGSFEKFHLTISAVTDDKINTATLKRICSCLTEAVESPILPKNELSAEETEELEAEKAQQRENTLKCRLQRIDQLLRKLVGAIGKTDKSKCKMANAARKTILDKYKMSGIDEVSDEALMKEFTMLILGEDTDCFHIPLAQSIRLAFDEFVTSRVS